ncbi:hypothetical protein J6590_103142, partial [Homalodisca vitripennis]
GNQVIQNNRVETECPNGELDFKSCPLNLRENMQRFPTGRKSGSFVPPQFFAA